MRNMLLTMIGLSTLTVSSVALATPSYYKCINHGYRRDSIEVSPLDVRLQASWPQGREEVGKIAAKSLGLKNDLAVYTVSLVLDRDSLCKAGPSPYTVNCAADKASGTILVQGYAYSEENVSASITAGLHVTLKNMKLESSFDPGSPNSLDRLYVNAETIVEINGQSFPMSWDTDYTPSGEGAFTYCEARK